MSLKNPTGINLGMSAKFMGRNYRVIGRAALGVMEGGSISYWNEYYLKAVGGEIATVVYERTAIGGEWRWFVQFDPKNPLTAAAAATKRMGDQVTVDDISGEIVLVRESRVYHAEGQTPDGVRAGAYANYFNAKAGNQLLVVSWTGNEVEFYRGMNLTRGTVASGFNIKAANLVPDESVVPMVWAAAGISICVVIFLVFLCVTNAPATRQRGLVVLKLPAPGLNTGASGNLRGINYHIAGHAEVEIAEVGRILIRHEYFLRDADGQPALLIYGWKGGEKTWMLFKPLTPNHPMTAHQAASIKLGQVVDLDGVVATNQEMFLSSVVRSDEADEPESATGDRRYGFVANAGGQCFLARWNEENIVFRLGIPLADREVISAFRSSR